MAKPKTKTTTPAPTGARAIAASNPNTEQLLLRVRPETIEGLDARTAEECARTGYDLKRTDLVRRVLAIVARDPEALRALLERE